MLLMEHGVVSQCIFSSFKAPYFTADDGNHGRELWRTDGTPGGTRMVMDICTGIQGSDPSNFYNF